jgi:hypothetical protein
MRVLFCPYKRPKEFEQITFCRSRTRTPSSLFYFKGEFFVLVLVLPHDCNLNKASRDAIRPNQELPVDVELAPRGVFIMLSFSFSQLTVIVSLSSKSSDVTISGSQSVAEILNSRYVLYVFKLRVKDSPSLISATVLYTPPLPSFTVR